MASVTHRASAVFVSEFPPDFDNPSRERIRRLLERVEKREGVRILYAVEAGSRAWGFASPSSDYDVRFVFVRPTDAYLRLEAPSSMITVPCADEGPEGRPCADAVRIDAEGWDVRKFLQLMRKSNPSVFEWLESTVVYAEAPSFKEVRSVAHGCFSPYSVAHHYMSMAYQNGRDMRSDSSVRLKKYLYVVRALLAARWVVESKTPAPIPFVRLEDAMLEPQMRPVVDDLVAIKKSGPGSSQQCIRMRVPQLDAWIADATEELTRKVGLLPKDGTPDWAPLDGAFRGVLLETCREGGMPQQTARRAENKR